MSLAICTLITWLVIIVFSLIPKKLDEIEMVFLFFVNTIFELSIFTIFHVNLKWLEVNHSMEKSFADLVLRIGLIPIVFIITSNILLYSWKYLKWIIVLAIILAFLLINKLIVWLGILTTTHWNLLYTLIVFSSYAVFSRLMAWFIIKVGRREVHKI
jgi:hypothetical protein